MVESSRHQFRIMLIAICEAGLLQIRKGKAAVESQNCRLSGGSSLA
jgi:hypothetical protein